MSPTKKSVETKKSTSPKMPEVHSIRVYQAVNFNKSSETFFSTEKVNNRRPCEITLHHNLNAIEVKGDKDHILVPFTNVSCVYLMSELKKDQQKNRKVEKEKALQNAASHVDTSKRPL